MHADNPLPRPRRSLPLLLLTLTAAALTGGTARAGLQNDQETDPLVQANLQKFQDMKFGLFIHWGPCSQWGARIAWPLSRAHTWARPDHLKAWTERGKDFERFSRDYFDLNKTFDPTAFDPDVWARAAKHAGMAALALGALGVVFGDIGTSPLYALQTVFSADDHAVSASSADVYGVI